MALVKAVQPFAEPQFHFRINHQNSLSATKPSLGHLTDWLWTCPPELLSNWSVSLVRTHKGHQLAHKKNTSIIIIMGLFLNSKAEDSLLWIRGGLVWGACCVFWPPWPSSKGMKQFPHFWAHQYPKQWRGRAFTSCLLTGSSHFTVTN